MAWYAGGGLGNVRHLDVSDTWVQDKLRAGAFTLTKIPGSENASDILTKHVDRSTLEKHLKALDLFVEEGRASAAPTLVHS